MLPGLTRECILPAPRVSAGAHPAFPGRGRETDYVADEVAYAPMEDTLRCYALRLYEAGLIKSSSQKIIAQGTDGCLPH